MPDLSKMTNDELEKRAELWEKLFQIAFNEEDDDVEEDL